MLLPCIGIIIIISLTSCQELTIRNLHKDLILMQKLSPCRMQTGNIRIIHPINLTDLEITINQLTTLIHDKEKNNSTLNQIAKHKIRELYSNFMQIKPVSHNRFKRWDIIGTTWKWIAGNPDAQDLRIIDKSLNQLVDENNHQIRINNQINNSISTLTSAINLIIERQHLNKNILDEIDVITTILNIDTINKILVNIQEAILFSKMHVTNSKMLSSREIHLVRTILSNQGVQIEIPEEALNLVIPKIATSHNTLLYILHVPELEPEESSIIRFKFWDM
uniref:Envelope protein n=1 Tax=Pitica errantivirus TaxID=3078414 RepID=A0AB38Z2R2_9VIRU